MDVDQNRPSWFLAQLKPNSAKIAQTHLRRQGFDTFLPMEEATVTRNGRFQTALRPLFPGYIFVAFGADQGHWRVINSTAGVTHLVSFGAQPAAVPHDLVQQIMHRCDPSGRFLPSAQWKSGDQVKLSHGPFANFVAEIDKIDPDRRVWVLLDIMGAQTRVAVPAHHLRAP